MSNRIESDGLMSGLSRFEARANSAVRMYLETEALKVQNTARSEAPWTDRTGQARQRLTTNVSVTDNGFRMELSHGVDYGMWLELAHEQRFAILDPTIKKESPRIVKGCKNLVNKIKM